jgi:hypothetical protein
MDGKQNLCAPRLCPGAAKDLGGAGEEPTQGRAGDPWGAVMLPPSATKAAPCREQPLFAMASQRPPEELPGQEQNLNAGDRICVDASLPGTSTEPELPAAS